MDLDFPEITVITVAYNSGDVLTSCLDAVATQLPGAEIVVVDNGSSEDLRPVVRDTVDARVLRGTNVGFGAGVNRGALAATRELLLVINPDVTVAHADRAELLELLAPGPVGIRACRENRHGHSQYALHAAWHWRFELMWGLFQWFVVPNEVEIPRPRARSRSARRWVSGAAFIVNRQEFLSLGGFDENLFLYFEDFELSERYQAAGLPVLGTDAVSTNHLGGMSSPRDTVQMIVFALLSLIEVVSKSKGVGTGLLAARACLTQLQWLEGMAARASRLPGIGARAQLKRGSLGDVRSMLVKMALGSVNPCPGHYELALSAVRSVAS